MASRHWVYAGLAVVTGYGLSRLVSGPKIKPGSRVLLVGDSLAVGLSPYLGALAAPKGIAFDSLAQVGTRIDQWSHAASLANKLKSFAPSLVMISLGTNDAYMMGPDIVNKQRAELRLLLSVVAASGADYFWIGPPSLPAAKTPAMLGMIADEIPSSHYFHSESLVLPRGPDGLHPTLTGYAGWAGQLWSRLV